MKNKLKKSLLFGILILGISLFTNCEKEESIISEQQNPQNVHRISLNDFNSTIKKNESYNKLESYFDLNQKTQNQSINRIEQGDDITILTNDILLIQKDDINYYTFKVLTNNSGDEFYNLVILVNNNQEIIKSEIYEYNPTNTWLQDTSQPYSGYVSVIENDVIDLNTVFARTGGVCIVGVSGYWNCGAGNDHEPGHDSCSTANNAVTEYITSLIYGPCSNDSYEPVFVDVPDSGGAWSPSSSGGNNTTNQDNTNDTDEDTTPVIPMEPTVQEEIVNCINGLSILGSENQTSIDPEIIDQLNLSKFQWAEINNNLQNSGCSEEAQQEAIEELLDFYDEIHITNELEGKALCVYNKLKDLSAGFKNAIKKFDGNSTIADIKFELDDTGETVAVYDNSGNIISYGAYTSFPDANNLITISINNVPSSNNNVNFQPNLLLAQTIAHEVIHAEMFRQILDAVENNTIIGLTIQDVIDALASSEYTELYEYFRQHQNWSHTYMAEHFRDVIARMTQEFDTGVPVPDNQQPEQLYLDLAWRGLMNNVAWANEGQNQTAIENTINNYVTNNSNETCVD